MFSETNKTIGIILIPTYIALDEEVSDVCAGSSGTYEDIVRELEEEIDKKNE